MTITEDTDDVGREDIEANLRRFEEHRLLNDPSRFITKGHPEYRAMQYRLAKLAIRHWLETRRMNMEFRWWDIRNALRDLKHAFRWRMRQ